jgi:hypothetical protein
MKGDEAVDTAEKCTDFLLLIVLWKKHQQVFDQ